MPLIECVEVSKDWAGSSVLEKANFCIEEGEKIGLVGRNGCGKTSLLRILAGQDDDFFGRLTRREDLKVALVPQAWEPPADRNCVDVLMDPARKARAQMTALEESLARDASEADARVAPLGVFAPALEPAPSGVHAPTGGTAALLAAYGEAMACFEAAGGEGAEESARRLLSRAGLGPQADSPASALSGGEKNVLALALALVGSPDLLLLDEPGNHLDFAGLAWLEEFIRGERRAILMVSHNRHLLDRCVDRIYELEDRRLSAYAGGYSAYRLEKLTRAAGQGKDWQADRKRLERLEALVRRFAEIAASRADPAWGKRLRARKSQLEREKASAAEKPSLGGSRMSVAFGAGRPKSDYALIVRGYRKAYGERILFEGAELDLLAGERAALVGPNGCGKTSFVRDLVAGEGRWDQGGALRVGPSMKIGYCAQEQEIFRGDRTANEEFNELGAIGDEAAKLLKRFLFDRESLDRPISSLSGGERNRLQIARAVFLGADFLVLDEPTNHLDIEGREALEEGLADFAGTILAVSHDRWFLEKIAQRIILVEGGHLVPYEGSFSEYWRDIGASRAGSPKCAAQRRPARGAAARGGRSEVGLEGRASALRIRGGPAGCDGREAPDRARRLLEDRITSLEKEKEAFESASAAATARRDFAAAGKAASAAAGSARMLDRLYAELEALD